MKTLRKHCEKCGGKNLKAHLATYPMKIGPKQLNVERVSVKECMDCHTLEPTKAGKEKIARCTMTFMQICVEADFSLV